MIDSPKHKMAIRRVRLKTELDADLRTFLMQLVQMEEIPYQITQTALKLHERLS